MTKTTNNSRFSLFRYQLLPINRHYQGDFLIGATVEDLIAKKNQIFRDVLVNTRSFSGRSEIIAKLLREDGDFLLYRVAANRSLRRELQDFREEELEHWPSVLVAIWNAPDLQLVAVQRRTNAFRKPEAVIGLILGALDEALKKFQLSVIWEPLFERSVFWDLARQYENRIKEIEFEIITPNMANISGTLPENLKEFAKRTNSVRNKVAIASDPDSALTVTEDDATLRGLVDYSAEGGGDIAVRVSGLKKRIHTSKSVREVEISEVELQGDPQQVAEALKALMAS